MIRWLVALALLLGASSAGLAQGCGPQNPNCIVPTAPPGTSDNRAASTAFVTQAITGGTANIITLNSTDAPINASGTSNPLFISATFTGAVFPASSQYTGEWLQIETQNGYAYGTGSNPPNFKSTPVAAEIVTDYNAAGQKFGGWNYAMQCWGMGDCFGQSYTVTAASGPVGGDEGIGFVSHGSTVQQKSDGLSFRTITSVTRTTCNTTTTQSVTGNPNAPQTITVASTTGCNINDWVVFNQQNYNANSYNTSPLKITAITPGTPGSITGVMALNMSNGVTVTPALVLGISGGMDRVGQLRAVVDRSRPTVTAGTAKAASPGSSDHFTGTGTAWSNTMVGDAHNIGCFYSSLDDYTGSPYNDGNPPPDSNGPLHAWYQIHAVNSATDLQIVSMTVTGDQTYHGFGGNSSAAYVIQQCGVVLFRDETNNLIILDSSPSSTWNINDNLEVVISPYPDFSPISWGVQTYSPGGTYRSVINLNNTGGRTWQGALAITGNMISGGGADTIAFTNGITIGNPGLFGFGLQISGAQNSGIALLDTSGTGSQILFSNGAHINFNSTENNIVFNFGNNRGTIDLIQTSTGSMELMRYFGASDKQNSGFQIGVALSNSANNLPTCASALEGSISWVPDSNTNVWGATITTGGANAVLTWCNGTNWTVVGK